MWRTIIFIITIPVIIAATNGCIKRQSNESGDDDGYYCVCNAVQCDEAPEAIKPLNPEKYVLITSSKSGLFFDVSNGVFELKKTSENSSPMIIVNRTDVYQEILGFGGAVTDSVGKNIHSLSNETSNHLIRSYFGPSGINYNFVRTPIGGTDFSSGPYTYAMVENDTSLQHFALSKEDYDYKIPIIKRAQELQNGKIKLLCLPWTASLWMKTNNSWTHNSKLRPEYRQLWADYFAKYFEVYRRNGLEFWGVTTQNEPENYKYIPQSVNLNGMRWTPEEESDWIVEYLAPTLKKNNFGNIKILTLDDNRMSLPDWPKTVFSNKKARDIIFGIAVHFYFDATVGPNVLDEVKELFPEKTLLYTEAALGVFQEKPVILGSWKRGELYAHNIIENLSHWVSSWVDWNIALNTDGGPNWIGNNVDSTIIVNSTADEFYKQPMFYSIGHFSKYVPPSSVRIGTVSENIEGIENIAFSTPDGGIALVILNLNEEEKEILINDPEKGTAKINVRGKSINTMKYW
ncbi:hypothetical protein PUN28_004409 [Cardiocondyla obscurior]|uniref:Glucosylceramidase n=1 Tax=Cardiocondyla obscurior TaxID=286306 RepID=A0AAW2GFC6_9HYME